MGIFIFYHKDYSIVSLAWIVIELIFGAGFLAIGAERFIVGSAALARNFNVPSLLIGILLVGFGTSFPELVVSAIASAHGKASIAIGNVVGSNIANIGLVLGLAALIVPISIHSRLIKREIPILILISLIVGMLLWNHYLSRWDGVILLAILAFQITWVSYSMMKQSDPIQKEISREALSPMSTRLAILWWFVGLGLLLGGSELLVDGAVKTAKILGISDLVIGLTIVTIGTSLPELAATVVGALKKEHDIAIGHVVGSNIFNTSAVLAMPALINPGTFPNSVTRRDFPIMLLFTIVLWFATFCIPGQKARLGRVVGAVFLLGYAGYLVYLFH